MLTIFITEYFGQMEFFKDERQNSNVLRAFGISRGAQIVMLFGGGIYKRGELFSEKLKVSPHPVFPNGGWYLKGRRGTETFFSGGGGHRRGTISPQGGAP